MPKISKLIIVWTVGMGIMFALYFAGNPFGVYDDIVIGVMAISYSFLVWRIP